MQSHKKLPENKTFLAKVEDAYSSFYEARNKTKKWIIGIAIIISLFFLIDTFVNQKGFFYFIIRELILLLSIFLLYKLGQLFHFLFGKWLIHKRKYRLTKEYIIEKMPRTLKFDGHTGSGKDSSVNAIRKTFQEDLQDDIKLELETIKMVCYPYDFKLIDSELDLYHEELLTNSKNKFFNVFRKMLEDNQCFIKKLYQSELSYEEHMEDFEKVKMDPFNKDNIKIKFIYDDGIRVQHFISLLIKYSIGYIRINYINHFLIANQPMMESEDKPAKLFSTKFTNMQQKSAEWPWPIDGRFIIIETESDAFHPNVGSKNNEQPMKSGLRNFKAFFRHFFGKESVYINIGQRSTRTHAQLRELDHSFIRIIEQSKVYGGEKRIWFLDKALTWIDFWIEHSIRSKAKEKQLKRRSKLFTKVIRLENSGFLYADANVYRDDRGGKAEEISLSSLLKHDKKILENYKVKLCFTIKDCYWGYNTSYIEAIAEIMANKSNITLNQVRDWSKDMIMRKEDMEYMSYNVLDDVIGDKNGKKKK